MKRDKWVTADELRKQYESKPNIIDFRDNTDPVRCVLINTNEEESRAFKALLVPRTPEYFSRSLNNYDNTRIVKDIEFKNATRKEKISHLLIHWDSVLKIKKDFKQFPHGAMVRKGDSFIVNFRNENV